MGTLYSALSMITLANIFSSKAVPLLFALVSFWHFAVIRHEELAPSIAFTAVSVPLVIFFLSELHTRSLVN